MTESETIQRIAELIKDRRECPRFEGRRSSDKQSGEVVEIISESLDTVIVERIALPNFKGETAASERATIKSDEWTASQIMATEGGRKCPMCGKYAKRSELGNLSFKAEFRQGWAHITMYGHLPGYGCNRSCKTTPCQE
jgi:hypothetical protein